MITKTVIEVRLYDILQGSTRLNSYEIYPFSQFERDLGMDSLDFVELIVKVEEEFHLFFSKETVNSINTIDQLLTAVNVELSK